jgi:Ni/Co efflux regulator RcnB
MRTLFISSLLFAIGLATANTQALADEHDNHRYVHHEEWKKGERMREEDWKRGEHIEYREHHLRAPPRGYEWRMVDGNYVLAAVATGVIASVVAAEVAAH